MEFIYFLLGVTVLYSTVHFFLLQKKAMVDRTGYEQVVSWVAIVLISLTFIGAMYGY